MLISIICSFSSCSKSNDDNNDNVNKIISSEGDGTNLIPQALTDTLSTIMPINRGQTPPDIEGMYRFNTLTVLDIAGGNGQIKSKSSINVSPEFFKYIYKSVLSNDSDEIDINNSYIYFKCSSQNNKQHAIYMAGTVGGSFEEDGTKHNNAAYDTLHVKASIQGADNKFTTYYVYTYTSASSSRTYKLGLVVSGEKTDSGITNLRACICTVNDINSLELYQDLNNDFNNSKDPNDSSLYDEDYQGLLKLSKTFQGIETLSAGNHILIGDLNNSIKTTSWPTEIIYWKNKSETKALTPREKKTSIINHCSKLISNLKKNKAMIPKEFNKNMITIKKE